MESVLFVCTGNICRSPTAEAVLKHRIIGTRLENRLRIDSAGTHGYHIGEPPDERAIHMALQHGIAMDGLRARKVEPNDFKHFDLILAMDSGHLRHLQRIVPRGSTAEVRLFLDYSGHMPEIDVPDPYYGSAHDFEEMFNLIDTGTIGMLKKLAT
ncbi:MAG: low molecular weight protein-tyrosine-phosphatase [Alphaproteobacteria bacterium]